MQVDYKGSVSPGKPHIGIRVISGSVAGEEVMLRPGVNTLDQRRWDGIKDRPSVVAMLAAGELVPLTGDKGGSFDVTASSPAVALDLIGRTTEPKVLEQWRAQIEGLKPERRQSWAAALTKLLKQIVDVTTDVDGKPAPQRPLQMLPA